MSRAPPPQEGDIMGCRVTSSEELQYEAESHKRQDSAK